MKRLGILVFIALTVSCTDNTKARNYGGEEEITLPKGEKLINVTWKETNLWYITRPMIATDSAITYTFKEKSSWGVWNGTIIIHETK